MTTRDHLFLTEYQFHDLMTYQKGKDLFCGFFFFLASLYFTFDLKYEYLKITNTLDLKYLLSSTTFRVMTVSDPWLET